jgi:hypothetical protein
LAYVLSVRSLSPPKPAGLAPPPPQRLAGMLQIGCGTVIAKKIFFFKKSHKMFRKKKYAKSGAISHFQINFLIWRDDQIFFDLTTKNFGGLFTVWEKTSELFPVSFAVLLTFVAQNCPHVTVICRKTTRKSNFATFYWLSK